MRIFVVIKYLSHFIVKFNVRFKSAASGWSRKFSYDILNFTIKCRNWNNPNPFNIRPQWQAIIKNRWLPQKKAGKKINQKILQISFSFLLCFCFNAEKVNAIWSNAEPKPSPDREHFLHLIFFNFFVLPSKSYEIVDDFWNESKQFIFIKEYLLYGLFGLMRSRI
jgi:hypothetical protein